MAPETDEMSWVLTVDIWRCKGHLRMPETILFKMKRKPSIRTTPSGRFIAEWGFEGVNLEGSLVRGWDLEVEEL